MSRKERYAWGLAVRMDWKHKPEEWIGSIGPRAVFKETELPKILEPSLIKPWTVRA